MIVLTLVVSSLLLYRPLVLRYMHTRAQLGWGWMPSVFCRVGSTTFREIKLSDATYVYYVAEQLFYL